MPHYIVRKYKGKGRTTCLLLGVMEGDIAQSAGNMAFVNQSDLDFCWKLQPLNGFVACLWHPKAGLYLPLNGKTWREASRDN